MENTITFEELTNLTSKVRDDKKGKYMEKFKIGREDAIKHITEGCYQKMQESAKKGFDKAFLYSFQWVEDKDSIVDKNGVKTIFEGNIRLLDLMTKGKDEFIKDLNYFFNKGNEDKYHCGFFKNNKDKEEIWNIYVSWGAVNKTENKKFIKKSTIIKDSKKI